MSGLYQVLLGWMAAHCISLPHSSLSGAGKNSNREAEQVGPFYEQGNGDSLITTTAENETVFVNEETLARRWKGDRVRGLWTAGHCRAMSVQAYIL